MKPSKWIFRLAGAAAVAAATLVGARVASADTLIDQWTSIKKPPAPVLKSVKIDPKKTALLVLDYLPRICRSAPDCEAALPKIGAFLAQARSHGMPVVYSIVGGAKTSEILKQVAPKGNEPYVSAHADKFIGTDLANILKKLDVTTVVVSGGASDGAVLYTGSHAAFLGYHVIVPVDGAWSGNPFTNLASAYVLSHAPGVSQKTTLTSFERMSF